MELLLSFTLSFLSMYINFISHNQLQLRFFYFFYHSNEENVNVPSSPSTMQSAFSRNLKTFMGTRILSLLGTGTAMGAGGVCER